MPITLEQPATPLLRPGDPAWGLGVTTSMELRPCPVTEVYAGLLWWPIHAAAGVLQVWRELTHTGVPDGFTTSVRLLRFPALPHIAEPVRGRWFVVADVVHRRRPAEADEILRPLRALAPLRDSVTTMPSQDLGLPQMEPGQPALPAIRPSSGRPSRRPPIRFGHPRRDQRRAAWPIKEGDRECGSLSGLRGGGRRSHRHPPLNDSPAVR